MTTRATLAAVAFLASAHAASAQVLFSETFDTNVTANWTTASSAAAASNTANYFFDYSTVGIPSAPGSGGTTRGLLLQANRPGGTPTFSGVSVSPNGQSFTGDYTLRFQAWQNSIGPFPAGGTGSTQMTGGGIGADGTTAQFPGTSVQGVLFSASGEGGTATDYRAYLGVGSPLTEASGVYAAGNTAGVTNNTNAYYSTFGNVAPPAAQTALFPATQTGNTMTGTQAFAWHQWEVQKAGNTVTWMIDGKLIATVDVTGKTFGGSNIFLSQFDINGTITTAGDGDTLLFGLIDNVQVVAPVPEPASVLAVGAVGAAAAGWGRWRVRRLRQVPA